ncbi:MAG TPA: M90 family metallopeptidase [Pirellulales bacterium]|nr:M90 family metallopeptidase [Pirellulales bacterium]
MTVRSLVLVYSSPTSRTLPGGYLVRQFPLVEMFVPWLRSRRRRALRAEAFPTAWLEILRHNVRLYGRLTATEKAKVQDFVHIFIAEKKWEGCAGFEISDEVRVTVAALVGILMLGFEGEYFEDILSILMYPNAYVAPGTLAVEGGTVLEGDSPRLGEAWYRGPIVLAWENVRADARRESHGRNVVLHEFAHQLDMLNGRVTDGMPPMDTVAQRQRWIEVVNREYAQLVEACEHGHPTLIDCYGTKNMSEFFAVSTETFFERPTVLRERHPELFEVLREFYRQDPIRLES